MTKNISTEPLVLERTFRAPIARVWNALTVLEEMRSWYFDLQGFKPEVGCKFEFVVEHEGARHHHLCRVTEVIPHQKIAYTWRYKDEEGDSLVTFNLSPDGDHTKLRLTHDGLETFPDSPAYARSNFEKGWNSLIGSSLKDYLENPEH